MHIKPDDWVLSDNKQIRTIFNKYFPKVVHPSVMKHVIIYYEYMRSQVLCISPYPPSLLVKFLTTKKFYQEITSFNCAL